MKLRLISLWNWCGIAAVVVASTVLVAIVFLVTAPFDPLRRSAGRVFRLCGTLLVRLNPLWSVRLSGWTGFATGRPCIVVANHQSMADIPALCFLPWEMKWLAKAGLFKLPGLGWMMSMAGDVPLRRSERASASSAMARCKWYLDRGMSVMIFPEGTRSADGEIGPFKDGAFRLALATGRPILPVAIAGTRHALPRSSWIFGGRCQARVEVLEPVHVEGLGEGDLDALKTRVRGEICAAFERLGKSTPTLPP